MFINLPHDVIKIIIRFLSIQEMLIFGLTNKTHRQIVDEQVSQFSVKLRDSIDAEHLALLVNKEKPFTIHSVLMLSNGELWQSIPTRKKFFKIPCDEKLARMSMVHGSSKNFNLMALHAAENNLFKKIPVELSQTLSEQVSKIDFKSAQIKESEIQMKKQEEEKKSSIARSFGQQTGKWAKSIEIFDFVIIHDEDQYVWLHQNNQFASIRNLEKTKIIKAVVDADYGFFLTEEKKLYYIQFDGNNNHHEAKLLEGEWQAVKSFSMDGHFLYLIDERNILHIVILNLILETTLFSFNPQKEPHKINFFAPLPLKEGEKSDTQKLSSAPKTT